MAASMGENYRGGGDRGGEGGRQGGDRGGAREGGRGGEGGLSREINYLAAKEMDTGLKEKKIII